MAPGQGVLALRTIDDALALRSALRGAQRLIVVGAGFVGCEVAASARARGVDVALVDMASGPLVRPLGVEPAAVVERVHRDRGVAMHLGRAVTHVLRQDGKLRGVRLDDGTEIDGDLAVVGIGAVPCVDWLQGSGLRLDNGVVCDALLRADGVDHVAAAGDVLRWPHPLYGGELTRVEHWTHAALSGMAAARALLDPASAEPFAVLPEFWSDQYDISIRGVGRTGGAAEVAFVQGGPQNGSFVATYSIGGRVVGALSMNANRALASWRRELTSAPAQAQRRLGSAVAACPAS
jgi:NADPH-dependent 2,4-dienoyl-CoA reductase/sulfur reductase-like enzyme